MDIGVLVGLGLLLAGLIIVAIDPTFRALMMARFRHPPARLDADPGASREITYFAGSPSGYAGYTDRFAVEVELHKGLLVRPAADQFALVGFSQGFSQMMLERAAKEGLAHKTVFRITAASAEDEQFIGWLGFIQRKGTDNAPPSTANLASALLRFSREISETGPLTLSFQERFLEHRHQTLEASQTAPTDLTVLNKLLVAGRERGERVAGEATVAAWPG